MTALEGFFITWITQSHWLKLQSSGSLREGFHLKSPSPDVPSQTVRVVLPFKDQPSANYVKQQLSNLSSKLNFTVQPVFVSPKLEQQLKRHEFKPILLINNVSFTDEFK